VPFQGPVIVIDEMSMSGAIGVNVRGLMTVRASRMVGVSAGIAVVIRASMPCCCI
jgi:hypothetical protein